MIGIILAALPLIILEVLAHVIFINMLRDDDDMAKVFSIGVGIVMFGLFLIAVHFGLMSM